MKRLLTIVVALALSLALAACSGNTNAPSGNTVLDLTGGGNSQIQILTQVIRSL